MNITLIRNFGKLVIVFITCISMLYLGGSLNVYADESQDLGELITKIDQNGRVYINARFNQDHEIEGLKQQKLLQYTTDHNDILTQAFTISSDENASPSQKLPYLYESEISILTEKLSQYSFANTLNFSKLNNQFSFYTSDPDALKDFYYSGLGYDIQETEFLTPATGDSSFAVDSFSSWSRNATDTSYPDLGENGSGAGQMIALIDSGVENQHPYLYKKVLFEACFQDNGSDDDDCPNGEVGKNSGLPCNYLAKGCGHGTFLAGIMVGNSENLNDPSGEKFAGRNGIAKDASLFSINVFSTYDDKSLCGRVDFCSLSSSKDQSDALDLIHVYNIYREQHRTKPTFTDLPPIAAVNISMGGSLFTTSCDNLKPYFDFTIDVHELKYKYNVPTVISAGNGIDNDGIGTWGTARPACISEAVTVGATDNNVTNPQIMALSNAKSDMVDIFAPGDLTISSELGGKMTPMSGRNGATSGAAAHVSAAFAILNNVFPPLSSNSIFPALSVDQKLKVLQDVAVPFGYTVPFRVFTPFPVVVAQIRESGRRLKLCKDYERLDTGNDSDFSLGTWSCVSNPIFEG